MLVHSIMKPWIKSSGYSPGIGPAGEFWSAMRADRDALEFWSDRITRFAADARRPLEAALQSLPKPSGFRDASRLMRTLVRENRRNGQPYEQELAFLYWLAAIRSFDMPVPDTIKRPSQSCIEFMPPAVVLNLTFEYGVLGYEKLELLNRNDARWLDEMWGNPQGHSTLYDIHREIWNAHAEKAQEARMMQIWTRV